MRDYEELVKRFRDKAGAFDYDGRPDIACDYEQAADAIEELITQQRGNEEAVKVMQMEIDRLLASQTQKREVESDA